MVLIPTSKSALASSLSATDPYTVLMGAAATVIQTAMNSGLQTASITISGKSASDVQKLINLLRNSLGYTVTNVAGTSLTVTW